MHEINKIYTCMHTHTHTALWLYPPMSMRTRCRERKGSPAKLTFFSSNIRIHSSQLNSTSYSLPSLTCHVNLVISSVLAIRNRVISVQSAADVVLGVMSLTSTKRWNDVPLALLWVQFSQSSFSSFWTVKVFRFKLEVFHVVIDFPHNLLKPKKQKQKFQHKWIE